MPKGPKPALQGISGRRTAAVPKKIRSLTRKNLDQKLKDGDLSQSENSIVALEQVASLLLSLSVAQPGLGQGVVPPAEVSAAHADAEATAQAAAQLVSLESSQAVAVPQLPRPLAVRKAAASTESARYNAARPGSKTGDPVVVLSGKNGSAFVRAATWPASGADGQEEVPAAGFPQPSSGAGNAEGTADTSMETVSSGHFWDSTNSSQSAPGTAKPAPEKGQGKRGPRSSQEGYNTRPAKICRMLFQLQQEGSVTLQFGPSGIPRENAHLLPEGIRCIFSIYSSNWHENVLKLNAAVRSVVSTEDPNCKAASSNLTNAMSYYGIVPLKTGGDKYNWVEPPGGVWAYDPYTFWRHATRRTKEFNPLYNDPVAFWMHSSLAAHPDNPIRKNPYAFWNDPARRDHPANPYRTHF